MLPGLLCMAVFMAYIGRLPGVVNQSLLHSHLFLLRSFCHVIYSCTGSVNIRPEYLCMKKAKMCCRSFPAGQCATVTCHGGLTLFLHFANTCALGNRPTCFLYRKFRSRGTLQRKGATSFSSKVMCRVNFTSVEAHMKSAENT